MRYMSDRALQASMAEMNEGETLVIITPSKRIVFECKSVDVHELKIEGNEASHIFYDEIPDLMLVDNVSGPIAGLMECLGGSIVDAKPSSDLFEAMAKSLALCQHDRLPKDKNRGPQPRRSFPVPK